MGGERKTGRPLWNRNKHAARTMRKAATPAEEALWLGVRNSQLGIKIRRQHPVGPWITDFCCPAARLVIELDGGAHRSQAERDAARDADVGRRGFKVLRFPNEQVLTRIESVLEEIGRVAAERISLLKQQPAETLST